MPSFPHIPFVVAFTDESRAEVFKGRRRPSHTTWCRVLALPSREPIAVPRASARAVIVVAEADSPIAARAAKLCWNAHESHIATVLVRTGADPAKLDWPLHPADAVVDLTHAETGPFMELLGRCVADTHPLHSPLTAREPADVVLISGDPRPQAFQRALEGECVTNELLFPRVPRNALEKESLALWFRPRTGAPQTARYTPLERRALPHDPRRYDCTIAPLDDTEARGRAIASLHATHGDWRATRRLVMDCAVGSPRERARLLSFVGTCLEESRACTWGGLTELAREAEAAAGADKKGRPFPPWVPLHKRAGHDANGEPWDVETLEGELAHVESVREEKRAMKRTGR